MSIEKLQAMKSNVAAFNEARAAEIKEIINEAFQKQKSGEMSKEDYNEVRWSAEDVAVEMGRQLSTWEAGGSVNIDFWVPSSVYC